MSKNPEPQLGVHLLETITLGMYSEPLHCVREYIQNAYDSIRTARRRDLLTPEEGCIDITVDSHSKSLQIRDDGVGLSPEEAIVRLVDIGHSDKACSDDAAAFNAGFRGIGRMAGISYCQRLVFETCDGGDRACTVAFDAQAINRLMRPGQVPTTITNAIDSNCKVSEQSSDFNSRFFQVSLEQVSNPKLLDVESLSSYLEQTAPVRHDPTKWKFQTQIRSFAESIGHPESLDTVSIRIRGTDGVTLREVYRPFKDSFETKDGRGKKLRSVEVTDVVGLPRNGNCRGWWGWLAQHSRSGALADLPFKGIRIRMHNIAVGDQSVVQALWTTPHLALWCFGEVHVIDPNLVPNSQRDDFEPSDALSRFLAEIKDEVKCIESEIRKESTDRNNSVPKTIQKVELVVSQAQSRLKHGLTSHNEKQQLIKSLNEEVDRLDKTIKGRNRTSDERMQLKETLHTVESLKEGVSKVQRTDADASMSHLNKQARVAVCTVLAVVKEELSDDRRFNVIEQRILAALRPGGQN